MVYVEDVRADTKPDLGHYTFMQLHLISGFSSETVGAFFAFKWYLNNTWTY